jgi:hypothetical protein
MSVFGNLKKNLTNFDPSYKKFHNRTDTNTHPLSNFLPKNEIPEGCNLCMTIIEYIQDLSFRLDIQTKLQLLLSIENGSLVNKIVHITHPKNHKNSEFAVAELIFEQEIHISLGCLNS